VLRSRLVLPAVVAAAALAACGGDGRSAEDVARGYVAGDDPAKCDDAAPAFLERRTRRRGEAARAACRAAVERFEAPKGVRVTSASHRGDSSEVRLVANGQKLSVRLARRDGRWLVTGIGG